MRALIVGDSADRARNLGALLTTLGVRVIGTVDGEQAACEWLAVHPEACDVAFVDVVLEARSGFGVLEQMSAAPTPKRIVLTNRVTAADRRTCRDLAATRVFDATKELQRLSAWIASYLRGGAPQRRSARSLARPSPTRRARAPARR